MQKSKKFPRVHLKLFLSTANLKCFRFFLVSLSGKKTIFLVFASFKLRRRIVCWCIVGKLTMFSSDIPTKSTVTAVKPQKK